MPEFCGLPGKRLFPKLERWYHFRSLHRNQPVKNESIAVRLRILAHEEVERAMGFLRPEDGSLPNVHECRKTFKRLRALLRLMRDSIGIRRYKKQNRFVRDLGRRLSDWRDREVMVVTVDHLLKKNADDLHLVQPLQRLREQFVVERDAALEGENLREVAEATAGDLAAMNGWIDRWPIAKEEGFCLIEVSLARTYRRARSGFATAKKRPTDENLHECRRRVKYLWTQCCILELLAPKSIKSRAKKLKRLSDLFGDDHDLAVLLERAQSRIETSADLIALKWACGVRRSELHKRALALGETLFKDKAKTWCQPLKKALS